MATTKKKSTKKAAPTTAALERQLRAHGAAIAGLLELVEPMAPAKVATLRDRIGVK